MRYVSEDHTLYDSFRRRLFLKVILHAVHEAEGKSIEQPNLRTRKNMIHSARVWLTNSSEGLLATCKLAEVGMEDVLEKYRGKYGVVK